jgi:cohesin loading factor subunit SCC2
VASYNEVSTRQNVVNCIKTIYILTTTDPSMLSPSQATMLLPYLKSATGVRCPVFHRNVAVLSLMQGDEQMISDYLLKIFRSCVPSMPKSAVKFANSLQSTLLMMINKPAAGAVVRVIGRD